MITTSQKRIDALTTSGRWGTETLHSMLAVHARLRPDQLAVKDQPNREQLTGDLPQALTWSELARASDNLVPQLIAAGIRENDRVIVQLPNIAELIVLYYAFSKMGVITSPIPVQYGSHELRNVAEALDAAAVITIGRLINLDLASNVRHALPDLKVLLFGEDLKLDTVERGQPPLVTNDANRVMSICWTSGTTGTPKGVPRSHNMWFAAGRCTSDASGYVSDDVLLCPFPLVNMAALGGFLFPAAQAGSTIIMHHPLDPALFLQQMQDERVSFTIAPPALLNQLAKSPDMWRQYDFNALRRVGSGSAPLAPWMIETFSREFGVEVVNIYGSNEGIALYATPETVPDPGARATMFPLPAEGSDLEARVTDPDSGDIVTGQGERGELLVRGATVFDGYFESDNTDVFDKDGYFHTGDLVEIGGEAGDCCKVVGRCKDIINRGGMKISPAELDVALEQHPDIVEAAVCPYPDSRLGEKICACLVMKPEAELMALKAVQDFLLGFGFAKFKLPERIEAYEQLPRNAVGKVQRFVLQEDVSAKVSSEPDSDL